MCLVFVATNLAIMTSSWASFALWVSFAAQLTTEGGAVGSSGSFARVTLDNDELALCNDGSSATYYIQQRESSDNGKWLVYLEGGGWCYDEATCASRYENSKSVGLRPNTPNRTAQSQTFQCHPPHTHHHRHSQLMSSEGYAETASIDGVMSDDPTESPLASATKVYVKYCSSEGWMGDAEASDDTFGWHFRGQHIISATLSHLIAEKGLGSQPDTTLVFGGGSAGARGAMFHLDSVAAMVAEASDGNVTQTLGFLDSPYWVDVEPLYPDTLTSLMDQAAQIQALSKGFDVSVTDEGCSAVYNNDAAPSGSANAWKCVYGQYRLPFVNTPYFVIAQQYDSFQLGEDMGHAPVTDDERSYADAFGAATRALVSTLPNHNTASAAVYSQACYNHCVSTSSSFYTKTTDEGVSESAALGLWLDDPTSNMRWVDTCVGYGCGSGC